MISRLVSLGNGAGAPLPSVVARQFSGSASSSSLHSHATLFLEWCDKIKLSNLLLPRKSGTIKSLQLPIHRLRSGDKRSGSDWKWSRGAACVHPEPYNLNPEPYNLNPEPYNLNPEPYNLNPEP